MKKFQYQTLRYMPDRLSGEFINLGVVVLALEQPALHCRFYSRTRRLHRFFPEVNSRFVVQTISKIEGALQRLKLQLEAPLFSEKKNNLDRLTQQVLPKDDSALFFSEVKTVLDLNGEVLVQELFERLITRHVSDEAKNSIQDSEVWSKIYKPYFDHSTFSAELKEAVIKTKHDEFHFEKTCQNGVLHCFEPISFALTTDEIIRRKAYTWAGRLQELEATNEPLHIYFLAAMPSSKKMETFLKDKFKNKKIGLAMVELIDEKHAAQLVTKMEKIMSDHGG